MLLHLNERLGVGAGASRSNRATCSASRAFVSGCTAHSNPSSYRRSIRPVCAATPAGGPEESNAGVNPDDTKRPDAALPQPKLSSSSKPIDGPLAAASDMQQQPQRRSRSKPTTPTAQETPLRDTNRDVMLGVLTLRAARTLVVYLQETNINVCQWLVTYMNKNPINLQGNWQDVSGDTFLRSLLSMPIQEARWDNGCDPLHNNSSTCGVDPRSIAQRILAIRAQLATELIQDMQLVAEDNSDLLQRCFRSSLERSLKGPAAEEPTQASLGRVADN